MIRFKRSPISLWIHLLYLYLPATLMQAFRQHEAVSPCILHVSMKCWQCRSPPFLLTLTLHWWKKDKCHYLPAILQTVSFYKTVYWSAKICHITCQTQSMMLLYVLLSTYWPRLNQPQNIGARAPTTNFLYFIIKQIIHKVHFSLHSPDLSYPIHIQTPCDSLNIVKEDGVQNICTGTLAWWLWLHSQL
jgi:hypothetical protein